MRAAEAAQREAAAAVNDRLFVCDWKITRKGERERERAIRCQSSSTESLTAAHFDRIKFLLVVI